MPHPNSKIDAAGKPVDKTYLETNLPPDLQKAVTDYVQGEQAGVSYMDCLWGELYGSINANFWGNVITEEQAAYLRAKYLFDESERDADD